MQGGFAASVVVDDERSDAPATCARRVNGGPRPAIANRSSATGPGLVYQDEATGYASFGDADTPAEVDAAFRLQRRIAFAHFLTFILVTFGVGVAIVALDWASSSRVFGGFSPGFALAAFGLYLFFVVVAVAAASLANSIEDRMMGAGSLPPEPPR